MKGHWWKGAAFLLGIASASCSDDPSGRADKNDVCFGQSVACVLTEDSGVGGIPVPRSDLQIPSLNEPYGEPTSDGIQLNTRFGTRQEYVEFYSDFMTGHAWSMEPTESQHSEGSPAVGPVELTSWSRPGTPYHVVITVADGLGGADDSYIAISVGKIPPQLVSASPTPD